jgi:hypothetical protein
MLALIDVDVFDNFLILIVLALACLSAVPRFLSLSKRTWNILNVAALVLFILDLTFFGRNLIAAAVHLLFYILLNRLYQRSGDRDLFQALLSSFLLLVTAASFAAEITFLFYFSTFVMAAVGHLVAQHFVREGERTVGGGEASAEAPRKAKPLGAGTWSGNTALGLVCISIPTAFLFFALPRVGTGFLQMGGEKVQRVSGFSEKVELDDIGKIKENSTVVMRVKPDTEDEQGVHSISHWRGVTFEYYDGRTWQRFM